MKKVAVAVAFTVVRSGAAFAIDHVACQGSRDEFAKIWSHLNGRDSVDAVRIERWHIITFPNRPPKVNSIQIG